MTVIGVDSAGKVAGCCILVNGEEIWCKAQNTGLTHSETLLPLLEQGFAATGLAPADVDAYGITAGPGSFTGLRIGLSLVKGLSMPSGAKVATVSTLYALARGCGRTGSVVCALNARRGEVYWAAFRREDEACERLTGDAAGPAAGLYQTLVALPAPLWVLGDGAQLVREAMPETMELNVVFNEEEPAIACRGAAWAAESQARAGTLVPAAQARPEYLRLSQAERERKARLEATAEKDALSRE